MVRTILFVLLLLILFIGGPLFYFRDDLELPSFLSVGSKVSPYHEWEEILLGKWDFYGKWKSPTLGIWTFEGDVEFFAKDSFQRRVTIKHYNSDSKDDDYLYFLQGGSISGHFVVDTIKGNWKEIVSDCDLLPPSIVGYSYKDFDACYKYYSVGNGWFFGNYQSKEVSSTIVKFNRDKIVTKESRFSDDFKQIYTFRRKKD
ncbi:MAG: hypothetical protein KIS77_03805 [Saprospiraceae bacterium]|nr:hypothetical protein [Saprospiraceae bacterium]